MNLWDFIKRLLGILPAVPSPGRPPELADEVPPSGEPKWLKIARSQVGQAEIPGPKNNPVILTYYAKAGFPQINDETTPWCAGFANWSLESASVPGCKSLSAREFLNWGKEVRKPYPGCVTVLWRDSPQSWQGHVGFWVGETATHVQLLGGNQGNKVCVQSFPKTQVLGYREPITASNSRTLKAQAAGLLLGDGLTIASIGGKGILESLPDALAIGDSVTSLASYWPYAALLGIMISILARMVTIWARLDSWATKGA